MSTSGGKADAYGSALAGQSEQLFQETSPARNELLQQLMEALQTGGVGSRIPMMNMLSENTARASNLAMDRARNTLGGRGISGTPYEQAMMNQLRQQGLIATQQAPILATQQFIEALIPFLQGQVGQGQAGLGQAGQIGASMYGSELGFMGELARGTTGMFNFGFGGGGG